MSRPVSFCKLISVINFAKHCIWPSSRYAFVNYIMAFLHCSFLIVIIYSLLLLNLIIVNDYHLIILQKLAPLNFPWMGYWVIRAQLLDLVRNSGLNHFFLFKYTKEWWIKANWWSICLTLPLIIRMISYKRVYFLLSVSQLKTTNNFPKE